jgi:2-oxoisovalerate dehydrogenase E1 component
MNTAATIRHMSGGQFGVPVVIRMATGAGKQLAAQHSHSLEGWYAHIPGLKVLAPATLEDARGMLWTALQDPDPVLIFENVMLYNRPASSTPMPGRSISPRPRCGAGRRYHADHLWRVALEDAGGGRGAGKDGIAAEVIDLRSLRPLDDATIIASVAKTRRAVIVDEGWRSGRCRPRSSARIMEQVFWSLDAPVGRVCSSRGADPLSQASGGGAIPQVPGIVAAAKAALGR